MIDECSRKGPYRGTSYCRKRLGHRATDHICTDGQGRSWVSGIEKTAIVLPSFTAPPLEDYL